MKKTLLFLALAASVTFSSCLRSDDLEILRHPIHVTGSVSPEFGIPVASGELNINDLLSHLSSNYQGLITDDDVITVEYNTELSDTIYAFSQIPNIGSKGGFEIEDAKDGLVWYSKDTVITDTVDIDFFDDVNFNGSVNMEHIWVDLAVRAYGECPESIRPHVRGTFQDLDVKYEDHGGTVHTFTDFTVSPIVINDITDGFERHFDSVDVAPIANDMPRRLILSYRLRFSVSDQFINENIANLYMGQVLDSVRMSKLIYTADINVTMPLSVQFNNLTFSFDTIDLGDGLSSVNLDSIIASISSGLSVDIDKSLIRLVLNNGIPMEFTLSAEMQDGAGNKLIELVDGATIASSYVALGTDGRYRATGDRQTVVESVLSNSDIDKLSRARNMKVVLRTDSDNKHVVIRRTDFLRLKAYLQTNPTVHIDIPVTDGGIL